ncbi:hypothetical protein BD413DRAFT_602559 [Trametes elegans]|nr:hypothetical protein BD413DRAFT_602559 [Trametes elegans]
MLVGPYLARSQTHFSRASTEEYVEDSEPEREVRRTQERTRRKTKRAETLVLVPTTEVIELTDSDASYHAVIPTRLRSPKLPVKPTIVIDISVQGPHTTLAVDGSGNSSPPRSNKRERTVNAPSSPRNADVDTLSGLDGATTDDSLPSIGKIFDFPRHPPKVPASDSQGREPAKIPELPCPSAPSPAGTAEDSGEEDGGALKLGRYAYAAPPPLRRTVSRTPSPADGGSVPPDGRPSTKTKRPPNHRFSDEFSDPELSRVLKCVSCDLAWTTRKTVPQKMKHIQTCAKKNRLSDETLLDSLPPTASSSKSATPAPASAPVPVPETLLEEVLRDATKKKPGRRQQVLQTVKSITETRETILDKARSLLQSSGAIRAGSSALRTAEGTPSPLEAEAPPATQAFSRSSLAARTETTLLFGPSRLAGQSSRLQGGIVRAGAAIAAESDVSPLTQAQHDDERGSSAAQPLETEEVPELPPSTQIFAPSKLATGSGATQNVVNVPGTYSPILSSQHPLNNVIDGRSALAGRAHPHPRHLRPHTSAPHSSSASHPPRSNPTQPACDDGGPLPGPSTAQVPPLARSPSPIGDGWSGPYSPGQPGASSVPDDYYHDAWDEWVHDVWDEGDGACLHFVPDANGAGPSRLPTQTQVRARTGDVRAPMSGLTTIPEDAPGASESAQPAGAPPAKKRARRKRAASEESDAAEGQEAAKAADIPQEELNAKMKEVILKDEALHLRILRYEPIHFDVFLQIAVGLGIPAKRSGLKNKVRAFLDQQAIHFYGADPSKSRTRRTRHP